MNNATNFAKNLKSKFVFVDNFFLMTAASDFPEDRSNNYPFLFTTELAVDLGLTLFTTDFAWKDAKQNLARTGVLAETINASEALLFPPITQKRSSFDYQSGITEARPAAQTNVYDAIKLTCRCGLDDPAGL